MAGPPKGALTLRPGDALCVTANGAATWKTVDDPLASTRDGAQALVGIPAFFGSDTGVLPVQVLSRGHAWMEFDAVSANGSSWTRNGRSPVESSVSATAFEPPIAGGDAWSLPITAIAGRAEYWTLVPRSDGTPSIFVTTDAGRTWTDVSAGLPKGLATWQVESLHATGTNVAWMTLDDAVGNRAVLQTIDQGRHWAFVTQLAFASCNTSTVPDGTISVCPGEAPVGATVTITSTARCQAPPDEPFLTFLGPKAVIGSGGGGVDVPISPAGNGFSAIFTIPATYDGGDATRTWGRQIPVTPGSGYSFATYPAAACSVPFTVVP